MPNSKSNRRGQEPNRRGKLSEKSSSFHGRLPAAMQTEKQLRRPKTLPDLLQDRSVASLSPGARPKKLTKLLLNVTIQGSVGAVQVIMSPENTVADLVAAAISQYVKECRRPILPTTNPSGFDLHYSQFSLESLTRDEKLMELGSRNFFLCPKKTVTDGGADVTTSSSTCSKEAGKAGKMGIPWLKFMDFLL
ncbi:Pentatricopeptide (PPR) repeat-containing protein-like [Melia azedarach]|nr:Pentatricopeptide (PPR) repeat-containing protein-like [Melia azedarach]